MVSYLHKQSFYFLGSHAISENKLQLREISLLVFHIYLKHHKGGFAYGKQTTTVFSSVSFS